MADSETSRFAARTALVAGIFALATAAAAVLAFHPYVPLMAFAAVLGALALDGAAAPLRARLRMPRALAVCAVALLGLGALAAALALSGPRVAEQGAALMERLPEALNRVERTLAGTGWGRTLATAGGAWDAERVRSALAGAWQPLAGVFATAFAALSGGGVVAALAFFLALDPRPYLEGLLHLARPERRPHHRDVLRALGRALRWWLVGRGASMAVVGALTLVGLALLGAPAALFLAVLAALFTFIPYLGPVLAGIPAVLVALAESPELALWVVALYTGIQVLENNLITPFIQARTVSLPPAVLILAQLLMGGVFGILGVLVATPLAVVVIVTVQALYVRDVLGERVSLMGDHAGRGRQAAARRQNG